MATAGATTGGVPGDEKTLLLDWMARQNNVSAAAMLRAISATHIVKERPEFGQTIRPSLGSILASTAIGSWDPDPDYFFHWLRDSALVIDALRHVIAEGAFAGEALVRFKEFVAFSLSLNRLDGGLFLRLADDFRKNIDPFFCNMCGTTTIFARLWGIAFLASRGLIRTRRSTFPNGRARNATVPHCGLSP